MPVNRILVLRLTEDGSVFLVFRYLALSSSPDESLGVDALSLKVFGYRTFLLLVGVLITEFRSLLRTEDVDQTAGLGGICVVILAGVARLRPGRDDSNFVGVV